MNEELCIMNFAVFFKPSASKKQKVEADGDSEKKVPAKKGKKAPLRKEDTIEPLPEGTDTSFPTEVNPDAKTKDGRKFTLKIASWNLNGIRAWYDKDKMSYMNSESPDILCVQETKCQEDQLPPGVIDKKYHIYWSPAEKAGYAGTGLYSKKKPINVTYGIGVAKHDDEGRVITAEYEDFFMVNAYVPNSGKGLVRLKYRTEEWDCAFTDYLKKLDAKKPVIMCGDLNVAHTPVDLKNPATNRNKTPGYTDQEREGFTKLLGEGFVDSFRALYPNARDCWSFWTYMMNARAKNIGWRLDYFVISERLQKDLCDSIIQQKVMGSDHCPIVLLMAGLK
ncbi:exodeoxyribonuclease-like [Saccostrea cucullata]|uniref:exodeoxyribonuclease-like n=1 Tax=Saccostrea cuccullata TaxID=36930 RepID=UPI002ED16695